MSRVGRLVRGTGIFIIAALGLSACGGTGFDQSAATKVIQSVDVNLDPAGAITEVASNAVYLDELSGKSSSNTDDYTVEEVVEDLPVRVSTQYTTDEGSGSNLKDLDGHTGRVDIAVTVENLTLDSTEVTYDVAGESRQSSALVGTPMSVAGSVELEDTTASSVVVDVESDNTTNGVVSQTTDGDAVVQWGTVLAPPQSEATTTFRLVADVEDFSTPEFDLAVQAGFHTDMSFEGMLTSTFDTSASSEYAMQQKAIELVADINGVLTRAGTTITEIRQNLDHTTDTLGVDAAQQLRQNSDDMVTEMQRVGEQLMALEAQVDGSLSGAETAMNSQLAEIVSSMSGMMGNTEATAPQLVTGQGCAATVEDAESNGSLYSTFLILGAQLEGYAEANAECRDEVVSEIQRTLGPEIPEAEVCEDASSITCTLFNAQVSVQDSLNELVQASKKNVQKLVDEQITDGALGYSQDIDGHLKEIGKVLTSVDGQAAKWSAVDDALKEMRAIRKDFRALHRYGRKSVSELKTHTNAIQDQNTEIAKNLCGVLKDKSAAHLDDDQIDAITKAHSDLVGIPCIEDPPEVLPPTETEKPDPETSPQPDEDERGGSEDPETPETDNADGGVEPTSTPSASATVGPASYQIEKPLVDENSVNAKMEDHLEDQIERWESVLEKTGYDPKSKKFAHFEEALDELENNVDAIRKGNAKDGTKGVQAALDEIGEWHAAATETYVDLESALETLAKDLPTDAKAEFDKFQRNATDRLPEDIDKQVRIVTDRFNNAQDSVIESYNTTISGLATTSDAVVNGTANQLDEQKASLEEQQGATTEALNASTTNVLESIHASTTSSTRDLEGASAQLGASLTNVILDLGDPDIQGSGILGSMSASSAMSDTADYQLALASQRAAGYANVRSEDIAEIMLRQAQFSASLEAAGTLPAFHLDVPSGARTQTIYAFHIGGDSK